MASKAKRLFTLASWLRGKGVVTAEEIAERFGVSKRTIYRDMSDLMDLGVPVRGEAGVGYTLAGGRG